MSFSEIVFCCIGHRNIRARHPTTFEFIKDPDLSLKGDCIIGVKADFNPEDIKRCLGWKHARIRISAAGITEEVDFTVNPGFSDKREIVIRMGGFLSSRTLGIRAEKGAAMLSRALIEKLKNPGTKIRVSINEEKTAEKI